MIYLVAKDISVDLSDVHCFSEIAQFMEFFKDSEGAHVLVVISESVAKDEAKAYKKLLKEENIVSVFLNKSKTVNELIKHQKGKLGAHLYLNEPFTENSLKVIQEAFPEQYAFEEQVSELGADIAASEEVSQVEGSVDAEELPTTDEKTLDDIDVPLEEEIEVPIVTEVEEENNEEESSEDFSALEGTIKTAVGIGEETDENELDDFDDMFESPEGDIMSANNENDENQNESLVFDLDVEGTKDQSADEGESLDLSSSGGEEETETIQGTSDGDLDLGGDEDLEIDLGGSDDLNLEGEGLDLEESAGDLDLNSSEVDLGTGDLDAEMDDLFTEELGEGSEDLALSDAGANEELELGTGDIELGAENDNESDLSASDEGELDLGLESDDGGIDLGSEADDDGIDLGSEADDGGLDLGDDLGGNNDLDLSSEEDNLTKTEATAEEFVMEGETDKAPSEDSLSENTFSEFDYKTGVLDVNEAVESSESSLTTTEESSEDFLGGGEDVVTSKEESAVAAAEVLEIGSDPLPTAVIKEDELVRLQATLQTIKSERDELRLKVESLEEEKRELKRSAATFQEDLDEARIELSIMKQRGDKSRTSDQESLLKSEERQKLLEGKLKALQGELVRVKQESRVDNNKVQAREKELESKIELMELDFSAQIKSREEKLLELKRCVETLEFNVETMGIQNQSLKEDRRVVEERLKLVVSSLRGSIDVLEEDAEVFTEQTNKNEDM